MAMTFCDVLYHTPWILRGWWPVDGEKAYSYRQRRTPEISLAADMATRCAVCQSRAGYGFAIHNRGFGECTVHIHSS